MSYCIGIDPRAGDLTAHDMDTGEITTMSFPRIIIDIDERIDIMFKTILSNFKDKIACICIFMLHQDKHLQKFIDKRLFYGIQVHLIYTGTMWTYINMVILLGDMQHIKCNLVWIFYSQDNCDVWQKQHGKMAFIHKFNNVKKLRNHAFINEIQRATKINHTPDIIMHGSPGLPFKKRYSKSIYVGLTLVIPNARVARIYARFIANDPNLMNFAPVFPSTYTIRAMNGDVLAKDILLGTNSCFSIDLADKFLEFICEFNPKGSCLLTQSFFTELLDYNGQNDGKAMVNFKIDINEIHKIICLDIWNYSETDAEMIKTFMESLSPIIPSFKLPKKYVCPKNLNTYDKSISAVGIDLGTSRCCCAVNRAFRIETVALDSVHRQLPSYIAFDEAQPKCGSVVQNNMRFESKAKSSVFDFKRIMGRDFHSIHKDANWPFTIERLNVTEISIKDEDFVDSICNRNLGIRLLGPGRKPIFQSPEQIAAAILQHIKGMAEELQGALQTQAVITVPAAFSTIQNNAIQRTGKLAGFDTIHLLQEPVAAAFTYFINREIPENATVFLADLGGGTLDICIFKIKNNTLKIIDQSGDPDLGGRDFDNILMDYFKAKIMMKYYVTWSHRRNHALMTKCQAIKEVLSEEESSDFDIDFIDPAVEEFLPLTREIFESLSKRLLLRVAIAIKKALKNANLKAEDIDKVLYAGGGCRMPMIQELMKRLFPDAEHFIDRNPDEVVAIGAAHYSYYLGMPKDKGDKECSII